MTYLQELHKEWEKRPKRNRGEIKRLENAKTKVSNTIIERDFQKRRLSDLAERIRNTLPRSYVFNGRVYRARRVRGGSTVLYEYDSAAGRIPSKLVETLTTQYLKLDDELDGLEIDLRKAREAEYRISERLVLVFGSIPLEIGGQLHDPESKGKTVFYVKRRNRSNIEPL